jgi:hypothetical protein
MERGGASSQPVLITQPQAMQQARGVGGGGGGRGERLVSNR